MDCSMMAIFTPCPVMPRAGRNSPEAVVLARFQQAAVSSSAPHKPGAVIEGVGVEIERCIRPADRSALLKAKLRHVDRSSKGSGVACVSCVGPAVGRGRSR